MTDVKNKKMISIVLSLLIALACWFYVINGENPTQTEVFTNIPVEMLNAKTLESKDLTIGYLPQQIEIASDKTPYESCLESFTVLLQMQEQPLFPDTERHLYHPLQKLAEEIRRNPQLDWDMEKEAQNIGISVAYLRKLFTVYFNCAPHNYILECRIQRATELLMYQKISIVNVAEQAGFQDPYYFSRIFKKRKGLSPLRFRAVFAP